jgi:surface carbohydrate biosynthesis protein
MANHVPLLIPVENQVRELDAKLLLACVAAQRGFPSILGPRAELHFRIASFPSGIYLAKGLAGRSAVLFKIVRRCGHEIATWDEEALVHLPAETYYGRRLSPQAMHYVSHLFAWGEDNAQLWRQYPGLPAGTPIHATGNPRADLLRPELRAFFDSEADRLRRDHGDFILLNTNFNHVNAYYPYMNLFQPASKDGAEPEFGEAAKGMTREYAAGLRDHKQAVLADFVALLPVLEQAFPEFTIILRPHPTENKAIYEAIADQCKRVRVTNEGNVVPWLMAAKALIHNGCTTGVEAYLLGIPALSYMASSDDAYDFGFYRLPNTLSYPCRSLDELKNTLRAILAEKPGARGGDPDRDAKDALIARYLAAQEGPLACERIVDVIEAIANDPPSFRKPSTGGRLARWCLEGGLGIAKKLEPYLPHSHNRPEFHRHRYPGISLAEVRSRVSRFQELLGSTRSVSVEPIHDELYRVSL